MKQKTSKFPVWLRKNIAASSTEATRALLDKNHLHTVCESARCPNQCECFARRRATFLILGEYCTRDCHYCAVLHGEPLPPDTNEPERIAQAVRSLGLEHVVITSVTRDDMPDGGAAHFHRTVSEIKKINPYTSIEVLTPDFLGNSDALSVVLTAGIDIFNHNVETVSRLYASVRPQARYERSLSVLAEAKEIAPDVLTKSGVMVGLGETDEEVCQVIDDLRAVQCDILTIGQYLQPCADKHAVERFVTPEEFVFFKAYAEDTGFRYVSASPFVRSSYNAEEVFNAVRTKQPAALQSC